MLQFAMMAFWGSAFCTMAAIARNHWVQYKLQPQAWAYTQKAHGRHDKIHLRR
jgi:hypothetical protein